MNNGYMRQNNFDLLRFAAAMEVVLTHGIEHLDLNVGWLRHVLTIFPGVPIFFVLSGFLISASYERNSNISQYALNRSLRIFPGLVTCLAVSIILASLVGGVVFPIVQTILWIAAQTTIFQFYNPDFLRGFGVGVLNGSLWTISVELQFYIALPLLYWVIGKRKTDQKFLILAVLFALIQLFVIKSQGESPSMIWKIVNVLLPTHLYLFLVGILLQRNYDKIRKIIEGRGLIWLAAYSVIALPCALTGISATGTLLHSILAIMLAFTAISLAMTARTLSKTLLRGNDVSYGIYIYHMPVINCLIYLQIMKSAESLILAIGLTVIAAILSWKLLEQPILRLKKNPLHSAK